MKFKILALAAFAIALTLFTPVISNAQQQNGDNQIINSAVYQTGVSNLATPVLIDTHKQQNVSIDMIQSVTGSGTTNISYILAPTEDGVFANSDTNHSVTLTAATSGTTKYCTVTNLVAAGHYGFFLWQVNNAYASQTITNSFKYYIKVGYP